MKRLFAGIVVVVGALWISACAPVDAPAGGAEAAPAKRHHTPSLMNRGGMMDDELDYGRTYQ